MKAGNESPINSLLNSWRNRGALNILRKRQGNPSSSSGSPPSLTSSSSSPSFLCVSFSVSLPRGSLCPSVGLPSLGPSVSLRPVVPLWLCEVIDSWELGESRRQGWGAGSGMEIEGYKLFVTGKQ